MTVETCKEPDKTHGICGKTGRKAMALRKGEKLNPERLKYQMIFTGTETVSADQVQEARKVVEEG